MQSGKMFLSHLQKTSCRIHRHFRSFSIKTTTEKVLPLSFFTEDEVAVKDAVSRFAKERIAPLVREMDEKNKMNSDLVKELFSNGIMGIEVPEKYGGTGNSLMSTILTIEELSKVEPAVAVMVAIQNALVCNFVMKFGSSEQKDKYLPLLCNEWVGSFCLSEASSGTDAFAMKTTAKSDGDDFILNGTKMWISNSDVANLFIVFANADPSKGYRGITTFAVEKSWPGVSVGPPEKKLGLRCSATCPVIFDNVRVPKEAILGELYQGYKYAAGFLNESRIGIGAQMLGISQGSLEIAIRYALERKQFGQLIYDFQGLQHEIAQIFARLEAGKLLVYNTARMAEAGLPIAKEAAMTKYYNAELTQDVTRKCIDWMGGVGFTTAFLAEKFYRDCKVGTIYEGTSLIQLTTIAKFIKKEYAS